MSNDQKCLLRCRHDDMAQAFKKAVADNTKLDPNDFFPFRADFTIDKLVNTNFYLKTEIPAVIHRNNKMIIKKIADEMETREWCW
jgi:hypothetical protein